VPSFGLSRWFANTSKVADPLVTSLEEVCKRREFCQAALLRVRGASCARCASKAMLINSLDGHLGALRATLATAEPHGLSERAPAEENQDGDRQQGERGTAGAVAADGLRLGPRGGDGGRPMA